MTRFVDRTPSPFQSWVPALQFGDDTVENRELLLFDCDRKKELQVLARLSYSDPPVPAVLLSHGAGATASRMTQLVDFWASHGFACLAPTHDDLDRMGTADSPRDVYSPDGAWNRAQDLRFLIDWLSRERSIRLRDGLHWVRFSSAQE